MSTTFDVFPGSNFIPTFNEIIGLANIKLREFLSNSGIFEEIWITVQLRKKDERRYNLEAYNRKDFVEAGLDMKFVQDNR